MDEELVRRVIERVLLQEGTRPADFRVPEDKSSFPKILCLDMNKWVDLGKAHYGRPGGEAFVSALEAVRNAVSAGKLVVPITSANLAEASESADLARRERFARFMVELSANHSMMHPDGVL